ncbi:MAG: hypothetical protein ACREJA_07065 [Candidatus Methylomirabilales bacterium]
MTAADGVGAPVTVHAIDRDRLVRDLRAAAATADVSAHGDPPVAWIKLHGMARAWRVLAAAIEDGEYDGCHPCRRHRRSESSQARCSEGERG